MSMMCMHYSLCSILFLYKMLYICNEELYLHLIMISGAMCTLVYNINAYNLSCLQSIVIAISVMVNRCIHYFSIVYLLQECPPVTSVCACVVSWPVCISCLDKALTPHRDWHVSDISYRRKQ